VFLQLLFLLGVCRKLEVSADLVSKHTEPSKNLTFVEMVFQQKLHPTAIQIKSDKNIALIVQMKTDTIRYGIEYLTCTDV